MKKLLLLSLALVPLTGCVTRGYQGLLPGKDFEAENVSVTISTIWGTQTMKFDRLKTRVSKYGPDMVNKEVQ